MVERLELQPQLLGSGPRDAPARQRTLAATIQWSYELLEDDERTAFARLAVFAGGCTLEAAERVCDAGLEVLGSLVDNSLLQGQPASGEARFTMLETVRRYALDRLAETDGDAVRLRHAEWLTELAETTEEAIQSGGDAVVWLDRVQAEHDNIRAALGWALADDRTEIALRLASALRYFWQVRGHFAEGGRWLDQALAQSAAAPPALRAKALAVAGTVAFFSGKDDYGADHQEGESAELRGALVRAGVLQETLAHR